MALMVRRSTATAWLINRSMLIGHFLKILAKGPQEPLCNTLRFSTGLTFLLPLTSDTTVAQRSSKPTVLHLLYPPFPSRGFENPHHVYTTRFGSCDIILHLLQSAGHSIYPKIMSSRLKTTLHLETISSILQARSIYCPCISISQPS